MTQIQTLTRRAIRKAAKSAKHVPIQIIPNSSDAPQQLGSSYYFTTPSGNTIIRHPGAYRWPMAYHGSTLRVVVGDRYVANLGQPNMMSLAQVV